MALKDLESRALKPADRIYKKTDERGLYVEVRPSGAKLWRLKYRFAGKDKRIALGSYPEVSPAEARRKRDEARQKLRDGIDPSAERQREKLLAQFAAANTFGDIAKEYIDKMVAEGRAEATTSKANWLLEQLAPVSKRPIGDLKPVDVLAALKRIEARGKYETARRCRSFASRVFRYAAATGRRERSHLHSARGAGCAEGHPPQRHSRTGGRRRAAANDRCLFRQCDHASYHAATAARHGSSRRASKGTVVGVRSRQGGVEDSA